MPVAASRTLAFAFPSYRLPFRPVCPNIEAWGCVEAPTWAKAHFFIAQMAAHDIIGQVTAIAGRVAGSEGLEIVDEIGRAHV